jgi:GDP-L-fucose synthase
MTALDPKTRIYIAGHRGMVGSAIWRRLESDGFGNLIGLSSSQLDLRDQASVESFFNHEKPEIVIDAAARVGGILANDSKPYEFLMENLQIQNNLIDTSHRHGIRKFIFLGSSCIYPKNTPQPMREEHLLTAQLEPTNQWYAVAKIAGVKACEAIRKQFGRDFVSLMPTNLYGPYDNFDLQNSHVLPALIRKFHEAKMNNQPKVVIWGTGKAKREFLYVDDLADACLYLMENYSHELHVNIGTGEDVMIVELANMIKNIVGYKGELINDLTKPDGTPRKLLNVNLLSSLGWKYKTSLEQGIFKVYQWYLENEPRMLKI